MKHLFRKIVYTFIDVYVFIVLTSCNNSSCFEVGSSIVSIEPTDSLFSLTLAGYGAPVEGRFSMGWKEVGTVPEIVSMTGTDDALYGIDSLGKLYRMNLINKQWIPIASSKALKYITVVQNDFFAVSLDGSWLHAKVTPISIQWNVLEMPLKNITSLTSLNSRIYATTMDDDLLEVSFDAGQLHWRRIGEAQSVLSMTGFKNRLFALTSNQILWWRNVQAGDVPWIKMGYNNGYTYNIDLRQIAVSCGRLYAIGMDDKLYISHNKSEGNLSARAIAIRKKNETVVLVGLDLTGFDYSFIKDVKHEIQKQEGIIPEAILINASHTHFAPVTQGWYSWIEPNQYPDTLYLEEVIKPGIIKAVSEAVDNLQPAHLFFSSTSTSIGGNRCLSPSEALCDSTLDVLKVEGLNHEMKDVVFLTGCHPVFRNANEECFTLNANFPAVAKDIVIKGTGATNAIFLQGCAGDINPLYEDYKRMGYMLAEDVLSTLSQPMDAIDGDITYYMDSILVPIQPWSRAQIVQFKSENSLYKGDLEADKNVRWADIMLKRYADGTIPHYMPVYVQTLNIGDWKVIGLSREVVTQYGIEIRKLWPDKHVSVLGYCNDVSSYLPARSHIKARTYEGYNSFFWYSQPSFFPEDILNIIVSAIKNNNR